MTRVLTTAEPWLADAMPEALVDTTDEVLAVEHLHAAGLAFPARHPAVDTTRPPDIRMPPFRWASGTWRRSPRRRERREASAPPPRSPTLGSASPARCWAGQSEARQAFARARDLFAESSHHALIAFTLLSELRDVALTYDAADPAAAAPACGRGGGGAGASRRRPWPGRLAARSPGSIASSSTGSGTRRTAILEDLPLPGNTYLRREVTDARAALARHRGEPEVAWAQIRPLFPHGPATEPGDLIHQEGLFLQRLAADLCLDAGDLPGARAWLEAHDRWLAWSGSVLGPAEGQLAWARYHWASGDAAVPAPPRTTPARWPPCRISPWSGWPSTASSARSRPRPETTRRPRGTWRPRSIWPSPARRPSSGR